MAMSIERRVFRLVFLVNLLFLIGLLGFSWWALEDLERAMLESDRDVELRYFTENGDKAHVQRVITSQIISTFIPNGVESETVLPIIFQSVPVPFEGEVESVDREYFVITQDFPEGKYYLAKDLQLFEEREQRLAIYITLLALFIVAASYGLASVFSKRISRPVRQFANNIGAIYTNTGNLQLAENYVDLELNETAAAINKLLSQIDDATARERMLISMASHELRTPVSVVLGAARIIESRQQLKPDDSITLQRILTAAEEMAANIRALLALVRQNPQDLQTEQVLLGELLNNLSHDYALENPVNSQRLQLNLLESPVILRTDKALVRMLLHNLISNALNHTTGQVSITEHTDYISVSDTGVEQAGAPFDKSDSYKPTSGLGLYIVNLACEQLGWQLEVIPSATGSKINIHFKPTPSAAVTAGI